MKIKITKTQTNYAQNEKISPVVFKELKQVEFEDTEMTQDTSQKSSNQSDVPKQLDIFGDQAHFSPNREDK